MSVRTIEAIVENGQIQLPSSLRLPENTKVYVLVPDVKTPSTSSIASPRLVHPEEAIEFRKIVVKDDPDAPL